MEQHWKRARGAFAVVLAPPALWLLLFFLVPMAVIWAYSFGQNRGLTDIALTGTFANYMRAFEPLYFGIFIKSAMLAAATTALCILVGFPVALAITFAQPRTKSWLLLLIMLPFWTNLLIRTYALIAVLRGEGYVNFTYHWLYDRTNDVFLTMGLSPLGPFQPLELLHNNFAVVFGLVYVNLPFMVLPLYSALDRMDRSLLEASLDLGAGHLRTILFVVVPLAAPGIASGILITFIPALGSYLTPDLLGGPDSQMIANVIERQFKRANDWPFGAALSFVLMYLTLLAIVAQAFMSKRARA
ncbi:MAG TPA: ABC transporter permease [Caulobacterales bacterium]|nr:ABC transporter permease [Caulobacterales bacterium]